MAELLLIIILTPILFILAFVLRLAIRLINFALVLLVWATKKLWQLVKYIVVMCYRGIIYLWRRYKTNRQAQRVGS